MKHRRVDDPDTFEGTSFRQGEPTLRLGYKEASLSIKGISVFIVLALLAVIGSNFYAGYLVQQAVSMTHASAIKDHGFIKGALDRTSCQVNLTVEERARFRESYAPGAFKRWCPWVDE